MAVTPVTSGVPQIWSGASAPMPPAKKMQDLYNNIDQGSSGSIDKAQFNWAFDNLKPPLGFKKLGADAIWNKIDPTGTGSVSQSNFVSGMTDLVSQIRNGASSNA